MTTVDAVKADEANVEATDPMICARCDKESASMIKLSAPDNTAEHVCWSCHYRTEKHINVSRRWERKRRG